MKKKINNKLTLWGRILIFLCIFIFIYLFTKNIKNSKEGFEQSDNFVLKTNIDLYDKFYADVYDYLVYNNLKDDYEIAKIVNKTNPSNGSSILDVGCGTGHHTALLSQKGYNVIGIDNSKDMILRARQNYPNYNFEVGNVLNNDIFAPNKFTHILCLYFTIYYIEDKDIFFKNVYNWLLPGGYFIIHLVDRERFDPILPPGNPIMLISPQKYSDKRITNTYVKFTDFSYNADFKLDKDNDIAIFTEKFKNDMNGKVRKNEHNLYMPELDSIVYKIQELGFINHGIIDLVECQYEYQYLYIFTKPL